MNSAVGSLAQYVASSESIFIMKADHTCRLLAVALTMILIALAPQMRPATAGEQRPLLRIARKVAGLDAWQEGEGGKIWNRKGNSYYWLTDNQLLIFRFTDTRSDRGIWTLSRRNVATGNATALPALSARFNESQGVHGWHSISPDGRWLLWVGGRGYCAALLNGSRFITWQQSTESQTVSVRWLGDSRHWVQGITQDGRMKGFIRHNVANPGEQKRIRLPGLDPLHIRSGSPYGHPVITWDNHLTTTTSTYPQSHSQSRVIKIGLEERARMKTHIVKAPMGWLFNYWGEPSHSGQRVAWECQPRKPSPRKGKVLRSIWVSRVDGRQMHHVGSIEHDKYDGIYNLQWLPSGRQLSFEYQKALYVVSAG